MIHCPQAKWKEPLATVFDTRLIIASLRYLIKRLVIWPAVSFDNQKIEKIVVVLGGNLGGAICSFNFLWSIHQHHPRTKILAISNNYFAVEGIRYFAPEIDVVSANALSAKKFILGKACTIKSAIADFKPDIIFLNHNFDISYSLPWFSKSFIIDSFTERESGYFGIKTDRPLSMAVRCSETMSWGERYERVLNQMEIPILHFQFQYPNAYPVKPTEPLICVQASVWSQQAAKAYPTENLIEVCEQLVSAGYRVIVLGEKNQRDLVRSEFLVSNELFEDACGKLGFIELVTTMGSADCNLVHDSGLMHLSGFLGVKTVVLSGPTDVLNSWNYNMDRLFVIQRSDVIPCYGSNSGYFDSCVSRSCLQYSADSVTKTLKVVVDDEKFKISN